MEEENQVFGKDAEAVDSNMNLESEDFNFYHQNKEEAKKSIDSSSADLSDFIDSLIQDIPDPSDEDVSLGIEKILERTHPVEKQPKTNKKKKVTFKVLFIAALLSMISFSCLYVVGSSHNISIENGFVTFAKDTMKIVFFGEDKEEYITVDALLADLELHGYDDILFPQEFVNNYDVYKVSVPIYSRDLFDQVSFEIVAEKGSYFFVICPIASNLQNFNYIDIENADTVCVNNININVFDLDNNDLTGEFMLKKYRYSIKTNVPYSNFIKIIETIGEN